MVLKTSPTQQQRGNEVLWDQTFIMLNIFFIQSNWIFYIKPEKTISFDFFLAGFEQGPMRFLLSWTWEQCYKTFFFSHADNKLWYKDNPLLICYYVILTHLNESKYICFKKRSSNDLLMKQILLTQKMSVCQILYCFKGLFTHSWC